MRALIVDGEELFTLSLKEVVSVAGPFATILLATSQADFLSTTAHDRNIDLVVLHPASLGPKGHDCAAIARQRYPRATILCFGENPSSINQHNIIYVARNIGVQALVAVIRQALRLPPLAAGRRAMPGTPNLAGLFAPHAAEANSPNSDQKNIYLERLSHRQRQILLMAGDGLANKEIAARLGIAEGTVKAHMHAIFKVLGVTNRTQAVVRFGGLARSATPMAVGNGEKSVKAFQPSA